MISDLILSVFAFYIYYQHRTSSKQWSLFFLFMGLSALIGGIYHGFTEIGELFKFLSWTLLSVALVFSIFAAYTKHLNIKLKSIVFIKSILLLMLSFYYADFIFMVIDTAVSLLGFIVIGNLLYLKSLSKYISYGILISLSSALFFIFKIRFHPQYLTQNDIGHYISILSLIIISVGVKKDYEKNSFNIKKA